MFTGFTQKLPEYEVITPQTNLSFTMRTLTVQEEERLKASFIAPQTIINHLNKCLFDAIVQKPESITDFNSFLKNITTKDRDTLLYALYHISYEEIRNYDVRCSNCGKQHAVTVKASDTFSMQSYPEDKNIITEEVKVPLKYMDTVTAVIYQPTLADEKSVLSEFANSAEFTTEIVTDSLFIKRFEQNIEEVVEPVIISDRKDILEGFQSLPSRDKRLIIKEYNDNFGKYESKLKMKVFCPHCSEQEVIDIDLVDSFFRALYE